MTNLEKAKKEGKCSFSPSTSYSASYYDEERYPWESEEEEKPAFLELSLKMLYTRVILIKILERVKK